MDETMITVRVQGSHRRVLAGGDRVTVDWRPGETLSQLLQRLEVPADAIWLLVVNGQRVDAGYRLAPGDQVEIMSPVGGG
ncbi:MAG: MoaD/ThiS family protein [Bacillota bacterium]